MADNESAQIYGPPEWMKQHLINQALVLKDIVLAQFCMSYRTERGRRKTKNCFSEFSMILIVF